TKPIEETPDQPEFMDITFKQGKPVAVNGVEMSFVDVIKKVNIAAGEHGVGRIDHIENRLVGIKSREVYEAPGATVLLKAHKAMENLTMERDLAHFKPMIEQQIANLTYNGLWFSPLMKSLKAFIQSSQDTVSGTVKVKLFKGNVYVVASKSEESLYDEDLATYTAADSFDQNASVGFIKLWGLPTQVASQVKQKNLQKNFMKDVMKTQTKEKVLVENKLEGESDE
ncbi:MAG: argininosuccinate synthase, partial [Apilactobacillus kunkeei]|nr:argininosuccinate synthase [Apilactobacillus kunkeei]